MSVLRQRVHHDGRVWVWQQVYERGAAGGVCDRIVTSRPVPRALLAMLGFDPRDVDVIRRMEAPLEPAAPAPPPSVLTPGQAQALQFAADGFGPEETAAKLGRSVHTVKQQLKTARKRLGGGNVTRAVAVAWRAGLIA